MDLCGVRTERPYPPSSTKANSNFNFFKSSRFSSDIGLFLLTVKVTWALRRTKLAEYADAMNFNWLKSHSAPPHRLAELADSCAAIYCATSSLPPFVRNAVLATHRTEAGTPTRTRAPRFRRLLDRPRPARGYNTGIEACGQNRGVRNRRGARAHRRARRHDRGPRTVSQPRRAVVLQNCGRQIAQGLSRGLRTHRQNAFPFACASIFPPSSGASSYNSPARRLWD